MSLRIILKPDQVQNWIIQRNGIPVRLPDTDADVAIRFDADKPEYEPISMDELIESMRFNHLALLVDEEPGNTFYRFIQHG